MHNWENFAFDLSSERKTMHSGMRDFEQNCVEQEKLKEVVHKALDINLFENGGTEFDQM